MTMLKEKSTAPAFSTKDGAGKQVRLKDFRGQKVVLYFYPKDDTPGCTKEACSFRDAFADFEKSGIKATPLRKIGAGLFGTALSFVIIALLETKIHSGLRPSVWWQILAYVFLSGSEVMVAVTCLEYAYTQSPPSMKSTMTAIWYFTYSIGTSFTTYVNASIANHGVFRNFTGARYFWLFVGIMLGFTVLFAIVSPFIKEKSYLVDQDYNGVAH